MCAHAWQDSRQTSLGERWEQPGWLIDSSRRQKSQPRLRHIPGTGNKHTGKGRESLNEGKDLDKRSLEARQKSGAREDVLKDTGRRHSNGPLDFQSSTFPNSQPLRKPRFQGPLHSSAWFHILLPCCTLECGKIVLTFSKDLLVGTGHRKSEKKLKS